MALPFLAFFQRPSSQGGRLSWVAPRSHLLKVAHACRWQAVYRVIPDEQPLIEQTLRDLVRLGSCKACVHCPTFSHSNVLSAV